ncbi:MAG TPA: DNA recombination protein RmuC [Prolixibacteraceae bacterium]|nr:DNA recombination protein RmuC [Prolixibacteraceae bacterium]
MMETQILTGLIVFNLLVTILLLFLRNKKNPELTSRIDSLDKSLLKIEAGLREDFRINREENSNIAKENRTELNTTLKDFQRELAITLKEITSQSKSDSVLQRDTLISSFKGFQETFDKNVESFNQLQREKFAFLGEEQKRMVDSTEKRLEEIRITVDEKLQKTLNERLGQSFELVVRQLENVQKGLGEMQTLAQDVGGLKRVLSNVKMRGSIGEVQLAMLLEQILAPGQYESNVKTKAGSADIVEFAIKLPGRDENNSVVWLPVDAKFPKDIYEQLQAAHDTGDLLKIDAAQKLLEQTIKKMARDIHDKYIDPPNTTDFGIMFLPFEGIYAEVVRRASLLDELQRTYKIVVTGPTTLAAILNSLQMGFKTLAIQQRSGEVWKVLGAVKKEFELFGRLVEKAQGNIQTGLNQLDDVLGKRTRAIQRKLKDVEVLESIDSKIILPELAEDELTED